MSDEEYVDPNSGKAMQPGSLAHNPSVLSLGLAVTPDEVDEAIRAEQGKGPKTEGEAEKFDPEEHTVEEVLSYVEEHPDEKKAVLRAEKKGKDRTGVVSKLEE